MRQVCSISVDGPTTETCDTTGIITTRAYDALGRVTSTTDGRGNTTTMDSTGKTPVFGVLKNGGQVFITVVKACSKK